MSLNNIQLYQILCSFKQKMERAEIFLINFHGFLSVPYLIMKNYVYVVIFWACHLPGLYEDIDWILWSTTIVCTFLFWLKNRKFNKYFKVMWSCCKNFIAIPFSKSVDKLPITEIEILMERKWINDSTFTIMWKEIHISCEAVWNLPHLFSSDENVIDFDRPESKTIRMNYSKHSLCVMGHCSMHTITRGCVSFKTWIFKVIL